MPTPNMSVILEYKLLCETYQLHQRGGDATQQRRIQCKLGVIVFHKPGREGGAKTMEKNQEETETSSFFPFHPAVRLLIRWESVLMRAHSLDVQAISLVQWGQEHKL